MNCIYKLILTKDTDHFKQGQIYIGQSRISNKGYITGGIIPRSLLKKYGKEIFKREIITQGDYNQILLDDLEKHYIRLYNSNNTGLNIASGGKNGSTTVLKLVHKYDLIGNYLQSYQSAELAAKDTNIESNYIRKSASSLSGKTSVFGTYWSYIKLNKIIPIKHPNKTEVHQYSLNGSYVCSFESITNALVTLGLKTNSISQALDKYKKAGNYQWCSYKVDNCGKYLYERGIKRRIGVDMFSKEGKYIKSFSSAAEAERELEISKGKISNCTMGKRKTAGGYQWRKTLKTNIL